MLNTFFEHLGVRLRNENDLSDMTWALCEANPVFKTLFLSFMFGKTYDYSKAEGFRREVTREDSRVDLFFNLNNEEFIIEVKIYDSNNHFEQYKTTYNNAHFGWIANYTTEAPEGIKVNIRTWRDFKTYLENSLIVDLEKESLIEKQIIHSYILYLTSVCSIITFKKMKLDNLSSLFQFYKLIEEIIPNTLSELGFDWSSRNTVGSAINSSRSGKYFYMLKKNGQGPSISPWFGIYYDENQTQIALEFPEWDCKSVYSSINPPLKGRMFYAEKENTYGWYSLWFILEEKYFLEFNLEKTTLERQKEILIEFFKEVIVSIQQYCE